jgi:ferritin-like metal-binding protein YciE
VPETLLQEKLVSQLQDAHAMEQNSKRMLDSSISIIEDEEIKRELEHHRQETEVHERLLAERLNDLGAKASTPKDLAAIGGALFKGLADQVRNDKPAKNARDDYVVEQFEIATYELLERLAKRAGDEETAEIAKRNRKDEEAMAKKIEKNWDRFVDLSVQEERTQVPA